MESVLVSLSFQSNCKIVALYPGIEQEELRLLLKNIFRINGQIVGVDTKSGLVLPLSLVCRSPHLVPNSKNELVVVESSPEPEITSDSVMSELIQFINGLRINKVLPDLNANLLLELLRENSTLLFAAYSVAISANDSEYLAEICRDISQSLLSSQGRSACEAQDEVLQVCDQLYINDRITENQLLYLRHLVLIREEEVAILYDKFQEHKNVSVFAKDLFDLSCTHPHQHSVKSLQVENSDDSSVSDDRDKYFDVLTGIVALMVRSHTATNIEASLLLDMVKQENPIVVAAYELFVADNNLDEMQDTLLRCVKLELHKYHKDNQDKVSSHKESETVENIWGDCVPDNFVKIIFSAVDTGVFSMKQGTALCDLFQADYDLLVAAWEVFTVQNNMADFTDSLKRIVRGIGLPSESVDMKDVNVIDAKKSLLMHSLDVLVKQSLVRADDAKLIFDSYVDGNVYVVHAVEKCCGDSNVKEFLQALCAFPDVQRGFPEVIDIITKIDNFNSDERDYLLDLLQMKNESINDICRSYKVDGDEGKVIFSLKKLAKNIPMLNDDAQRTVLEVLERSSAITSTQFSFLCDLVGRSDDKIRGVFSRYESSKNVHDLIEGLRALCEKDTSDHDDNSSTAETKFLRIVQSMNLSQLETSALRLAISKNDNSIRTAIDEFRESLDEVSLQNALRNIAQSIIQFTVKGSPNDSSDLKDDIYEAEVSSNSLITPQLARDRVFPILISELVKESILTARIGEAIMKQFAVGNPVISAALDVYDRENDMGQLVDTLQEFAEVLKLN